MLNIKFVIKFFCITESVFFWNWKSFTIATFIYNIKKLEKRYI